MKRCPKLDGPKLALCTTGFVLAASLSPAYAQTPFSVMGAIEGGLTIARSSSLDISNNHVILNDPGGSGDSTIQGYLAAGFNSVPWNGTSISTASIITSDTPGTTFGIGWADGASGISGISSNQLSIKYTLYGDTNLNGAINSTDFGDFAANFDDAVPTWETGDFTYSGIVNSTDFGLLAVDFGSSAGSTPAVTADEWAALDAFAQANGLMSVPEPASTSVALIAGMGLLARRRQRAKNR